MSTDMAPLKETFGDRVREIRTSKQITQAELARRVGIHQPVLCDLEKGRHSATLATVERIASALGVTPSELIS